MAGQKKRSLRRLTARLLRRVGDQGQTLFQSTAASVVGNLSQLGLMGFGALLILRCTGHTASGSPPLWGALAALSSALIVLCRYWEGYLSHAGAYRLLARERISLYRVLGRLAPACLTDRQKGDILSIATADIETIEFFFAHTIGPAITVILLPLITLTIAGRCHPLFVWALLPVYICMSVLLPLAAMGAGRDVGTRRREQLGDMKSLILESVCGLRDIQIFGHAARRLAIVAAKDAEINRSTHWLTLHRQIVTAAPVFLVYLARIALLAIASYLAPQGNGDPVALVALSFVVSASFSSTQSLTTVISSLLETYAAAERIFALEDAEPAVAEAEDARILTAVEEIAFHDVSFRYEADADLILDHLSLTIRKGETIGIMGESGIGKSTILRLLLRFWDVSGGSITVNGIPLRQLSPRSLRSRIALLEQDVFLFDDTIAANIAFGKPQASPEEIARAAGRARLHDFIMTLPDGYETRMGETASRLSGGERQRVGVARIMLIDPDVIVMDEPTSNLDIFNEKGLLKTLSEVYSDKTVIIVSHRVSALAGCDRVLDLRDGRLVERRSGSESE
ncbi:MAG: ABC transporter ATP-binding protein/permease [Peptococcaceae bacterium]|jgi:ATP-binding cassette subfamily C protein|nr:ABC transporter ATP-binding protein/permease [Peptococcaceae bacterium]